MKHGIGVRINEIMGPESKWFGAFLYEFFGGVENFSLTFLLLNYRIN
jgi:hypothetical protein